MLLKWKEFPSSKGSEFKRSVVHSPNFQASSVQASVCPDSKRVVVQSQESKRPVGQISSVHLSRIQESRVQESRVQMFRIYVQSAAFPVCLFKSQCYLLQRVLWQCFVIMSKLHFHVYSFS